MKNSGHSSRPPGRGGKGPRRPSQDRNQKPAGNSQHRSNTRSRNAEATKAWINASSETLTSHISMVGRKRQDNQSKNVSDKSGSGSGRFANKDKGTYRSEKDKFRKNNASARPSRPSDQRPSDQRPADQNRHEGKETSPSQDSGQGTQKILNNIGPFELFCSYHLGIGKNNEYHPSNINEVANRFRVEPAVIRQISKEYGMDSASLLDKEFDMALAQLDIQVAPEGVNRTELARNIYEEFLEAPVVKRDWSKLLEEDRKENQKIFGR